MDSQNLHQLAYQSLLNLACEDGINASSREEVFGCIFGRDSALTILKILRAHQRQPIPALMQICKNALLHLVALQGQEFNLESGEQPGKFIHEFRKDKYEHLLNSSKPWFIYPDGILRNYDSIDSTPLNLIAIYKYWQLTSDDEFLVTVLPAVESGLNWIITFGDQDKDYLLEYEFSPTRQFGGLVVQSWTDSHESIITSEGLMPKYPIAPIEVQAYAWLALKLWSQFYLTQSPAFAHKLSLQANKLKDKFNEQFIFRDQGLFFGVQALDGNKHQIQTVTANPLLCLWASYQNSSQVESIVDPLFINDFVKRAFMSDMFVEDAGIRTMSALSPTFNARQDSYHNGSFWPILNGMIVEGLENFELYENSQKLKTASLLPLTYFGCPIELYIKNENGYSEYHSPTDQTGCRFQAWSAASILDMTIE
ncbi:MAG: hypothetical protein M1142_06395 [Patescibacteria group bacterium]|nr:hypothetical protein [Patescibacteria group bacterium]